MNLLAETGVPIGSTFKSPFGVDKSIGDLVSVLLRGSLAIAGVLILFFIVFGGISMIAGAGADKPDQAAKGKQALTSAGIGFIIVFVAYWIIRIIEVITGSNFITQPAF
jgi:hypothetical protein